MFKVIFAYAIELRSNYFSIITVICDISKQIEQRCQEKQHSKVVYKKKN